MKLNKRLAVLFLFINISVIIFSQTLTVEQILNEYQSDQISREEVQEIMESLKKAGYEPGPELDKLINDQGFDSLKFREMLPPPNNNLEKTEHKNTKKKNLGIIYPSLDLKFKNSTFSLTSSAVVNGELLEEFKGEEKINGIENSIPLKWENVPKGTTSLAIIMYHYPRTDDKSNVNTYLLLWNIKPTVTQIKYGEADDGDWFMGSNKDGNAISYTSPNSPSAGEHIYQISIFALSKTLSVLPQESSLEVDFDLFMSEMETNKIIGKADLVFKDINLN